jgi:hypothetical protein
MVCVSRRQQKIVVKKMPAGSQLSIIKHSVGYEHMTATNLANDYISEITL